MQMHFEIKRIDLWSLFKISFILYAVVGVLAGFFMLFFSLLMGGLGSAFMQEEEFPGFPLLGGAIGFVMIPFLAFFYGIIGSVFATIGGWIFNIVCRLSGGLRFDANTHEMGPAGMMPAVPQSPPPPAAQQESPLSSGPGGGPQAGGPVTGGPA